MFYKNRTFLWWFHHHLKTKMGDWKWNGIKSLFENHIIGGHFLYPVICLTFSINYTFLRCSSFQWQYSFVFCKKTHYSCVFFAFSKVDVNYEMLLNQYRLLFHATLKESRTSQQCTATECSAPSRGQKRKVWLCLYYFILLTKWPWFLEKWHHISDQITVLIIGPI